MVSIQTPFQVVKHEIQSGQSLGKYLVNYGVSYAQIDKIAAKLEEQNTMYVI